MNNFKNGNWTQRVEIATEAVGTIALLVEAGVKMKNARKAAKTSADEIGRILGDGWTRSIYGSNGSGWKFIENAHPDNMVFYHGGGGLNEGSYWGVKSGKTGTIKIVDTPTFVPLPKDKATIVYREDW